MQNFDYLKNFEYEMSDEEVYSWIFLALGFASSVSPVKFNEIIEIADGINHAVPTHKELQKSYRWLLKHKLIQKEEKKYSLTAEGQMLFKTANDILCFSQKRNYLKDNFVALNS